MSTSSSRARLTAWACLLGLALSCSAPGPASVRSLLGEELHALELDADERAQLERSVEDAAIWHGRRLSYAYAYREAIAVYSAALLRSPDSPRLLRHRGHRYITVRELDNALADLSRAALLAADLPDELEPDGAPNAAGIPRSTLRSNICYHLALTQYLQGKFDDAARSWTEGLAFARVNDDGLVSSSWWLLLSVLRAGGSVPGAPSADEILAPIQGQLEILENHAYHRLLAMARGELSPEQVLSEAGPAGSVAWATSAYGVASWLMARGQEREGLSLCEQALSCPQWMAFGVIAAEAELQRRGLRPPARG